MSKIFRYIAIGLLVLGFAIIVITISKFGTVSINLPPDPHKLSDFGAFIGGLVGSIFSLAVALFIYITFVESKQVAFESTFFNMLKIHNDLVNDISFEDVSKLITGRRCFKKFYDILRGGYLNSKTEFSHDKNIKWIQKNSGLKIKESHPEILYKINPPGIDEEVNDEFQIEFAQYIFNDLYDNQNANLNHYFRFLYHIIKTIDESTISGKKKYTGIMRANLSSYEQILLFYNTIWMGQNGKFKRLIEKYKLFKNIQTELVFNDVHTSFYDKKAFGNDD
jgi:hypothetical protein